MAPATSELGIEDMWVADPNENGEPVGPAPRPPGWW